MSNNWFSIHAQGHGVVDVAIEGTIGAGDARQFCAALPRDARTIRVRIASLGGDATDGLAMAQALRAHPARVEVRVEKIAASAATLPVMAGNHVIVGADAAAMLHNPGIVSTDAAPRDARALRAAAAELDRIKDQMLSVYRWRMKGGPEAIGRLMDATTWLDPAEAVARGLADEVGPASAGITACFDARAVAMLGEIPARFRTLIARLRDPRGPLAPVPPGRGIGERAARLGDHRALDSPQETYAKLNRPAPPRNVFDLYRERDERRLATRPGGGR